MLLIMDKYINKDVSKIFDSINKVSVVAFDFTNITNITDEFCNDFYQEYIWLINPGTVYVNKYVLDRFSSCLPKTVGTENFINKFEVKECIEV